MAASDQAETGGRFAPRKGNVRVFDWNRNIPTVGPRLGEIGRLFGRRQPPLLAGSIMERQKSAECQKTSFFVNDVRIVRGASDIAESSVRIGPAPISGMQSRR